MPHAPLTRRSLLAAPLAARAAARKPNIVFILLDDLGYGDLGCYGQKKIRTPHIDALARESVRFTDCYAGGAVCAPSRSVLMTGLHTGHTAVRANAGTIPILPGDFTVAELLKEAGYATGGFGKWGLGDAGTAGMPTRQGFDEFFGYLHQVHAHNHYPEFLWSNAEKYPLPGNAGGGRRQYAADVIGERSLDFVRRHKDRPFFLYAATTLPHGRFEAPSLEPYESEPWTEGQKTYAAMITRADTYVGRILSLLGELRLERDTIVFLTSDNGAHSGEDKGFEFFQSNGALRGEKGQLYEGGIRVPMLARWPGRTTAGTVSRYPWMFSDFLPTAADLADARTPAGLDGVSVVPVLEGKQPPVREYLYWEFLTYDNRGKRLREDAMSQAVRMGQWKGLRLKPGAPLALYDLDKDPSETTDLSGARPEIVRRIEAILAKARTAPRPHHTGSMQWVS